MHHPVVGDLDLVFEGLSVASDPGLSIITCTAQPRSPSHDSLRLLATWVATHDDDLPHQARDGSSATATTDTNHS